MTIALPSGSLQYSITGSYTAGFDVNADNLGGSTLQARPVTVGGGTGVVHMTTCDGLRYDFQAAGDFVVAQSSRSGQSVEQSRCRRRRGAATSASYTQELGAMVGWRPA